MFMFIMIINFLILFLMVFMSVAFFTLLERKVLGYIQLRKGPNKFFIKGVFQPMGDGLKLFFKEVNYPSNMNVLIFMIYPMLGLLISVFFFIYLSLYWYKLYYGFWFNLYILLFKFNSLYFFNN